MTNITPSYDWANGMALQPDGKIVVVGSASAGSDNGKIGLTGLAPRDRTGAMRTPHLRRHPRTNG